MATATQISVQSDASAELRVPEIAPEAAAKTTALLQANHVDHDMIFNDYGLHSRIQLLLSFFLLIELNVLQTTSPITYTPHLHWEPTLTSCKACTIVMLSHNDHLASSTNR